MRLEQKILSNLVTNEEFSRKAIPHLKKEYFQDNKEAVIAELLINFFNEYNTMATTSILSIEINNIRGVSEQILSEYVSYIDALVDHESNLKWLITETESFCKERAVYNAILRSVKIIEGNDKALTPDSIPSLLQEALAVSFDSHIGHNYFEDYKDRFEHYHNEDEKIPFDIEMLNLVTKNGFKKGTLAVFMAPPKVGKSLFLCHIAKSTLTQGKNVLYITLEMGDKEISQRIEQNLMDVTADQLCALEFDRYESKILKLRKKIQGNLVVRQYPTSAAHAGHMRALIEELKVKKNFIPDMIMVDYLNICASQRVKKGNSGSYDYVKSIAEEIRGLAVEYQVPIVSATQINREGSNNSDPEMSNVSESFGLPATVDYFFAIISNEEIAQSGQIMVKQLANRHASTDMYKKFFLGIDKEKMRLYNLERSAQENIAGQVAEGDFSGFKF